MSRESCSRAWPRASNVVATLAIIIVCSFPLIAKGLPFSAPVILSSSISACKHITLFDVTNDGFVDVLVAGYGLVAVVTSAPPHDGTFNALMIVTSSHSSAYRTIAADVRRLLVNFEKETGFSRRFVCMCAVFLFPLFARSRRSTRTGTAT